MSNFKTLTQQNQVAYLKQHYIALVKGVFYNPLSLKQYVDSKVIDSLQLNKIIITIESLNKFNCICCREIHPAKLNILCSNQVPKDLFPLIDISQFICNKNTY
jgi:hypothetical protein